MFIFGGKNVADVLLFLNDSVAGLNSALLLNKRTFSRKSLCFKNIFDTWNEFFEK